MGTRRGEMSSHPPHRSSLSQRAAVRLGANRTKGDSAFILCRPVNQPSIHRRVTECIEPGGRAQVNLGEQMLRALLKPWVDQQPGPRPMQVRCCRFIPFPGLRSRIWYGREWPKARCTRGCEETARVCHHPPR
jgi:hypothetical protein